MAEMKTRVEEAVSDLWDEMPTDSHISREQVESSKAARRREAQQLAYLREEQKKKRLQREQYEESNRELLEQLLDGDATVAQMEVEIDEQQSTLDEMHSEYRGVCEKLAAIADSDKVDLSTVKVGTLLQTALKRRKSTGDEAAALGAVKTELERRIAQAEAGVGELRAECMKAKRVVIHHHVDEKIVEIRPLLEQGLTLFKEIRRAEEMIRGLGGSRQAFLTPSLPERLEHAISRLDKERSEITQFSERYD